MGTNRTAVPKPAMKLSTCPRKNAPQLPKVKPGRTSCQAFCITHQLGKSAPAKLSRAKAAAAKKARVQAMGRKGRRFMGQLSFLPRPAAARQPIGRSWIAGLSLTHSRAGRKAPESARGYTQAGPWATSMYAFPNGLLHV